MSKVSTYLNFARQAEAAFNFYRKVFGTEFEGHIARFADLPPSPGMPVPPEADRQLIMHVTLPILGGHVLMGTDAPESMGFKVIPGNNFYINLEPDTRAETVALFNALAEDGTIEQPLGEMFWGAFYGSLKDKFGVQWMFNCTEPKAE